MCKWNTAHLPFHLDDRDDQESMRPLCGGYRSCACDRIAQVKPGLKGSTVCRNELGIGSPEGASIYLAQLEQMLSVTLACGSG